MRYFNSFQLMSLFTAAPFLVTWCKDADFYGHTALTWVLIAGFVVGFGSLTVLVADNIDKG